MTDAIHTPRVSVVLPTHNRPALLAEAVNSVCTQTFADWELVVVDDASQPPVQLDVPIALRNKVRCVRHTQSQGGAAAKSTGIAEGRGEVFAFLDDDDVYDTRYLERASSVLDRNPEVDVLFMGVGWFGSSAAWGEKAHGESTARLLADARPQLLEANVSVFGDQLFPALLKRVPMAFQRPVVRRAALDRIGAYRADCLLWDCEWALKASLVARCAYLAEPLYRQRLDGQGYSSQDKRELDHLMSGLDIGLRLLSVPPVEVSPTTRALMTHASGQAALSIARHHARKRQVGQAISAWKRGRVIDPAGVGPRSLLSLARTLLTGRV